MGMLDEFRKTGAMRLIARCRERASVIFTHQKKKAILAAISILLLTGGMGWAAPGGHWRSAAWAQDNGGVFGGPRSGHSAQREEHLPQWFRRHQYLPPQAQERALRKQPGFDRLPPAKQQRLLNRLRQLDSMPPLKRERTLQWMEALERLSPEQRQQVRSAMQEVTTMAPDRRRMMHKAFRDLSQMPRDQRWAILNSSQFRAEFSDWERETLGTLLSVQPYVPAPRSGPGLAYGGR